MPSIVTTLKSWYNKKRLYRWKATTITRCDLIKQTDNWRAHNRVIVITFFNLNKWFGYFFGRFYNGVIPLKDALVSRKDTSNLSPKAKRVEVENFNISNVVTEGIHLVNAGLKRSRRRIWRYFIGWRQGL